MIQENPFNLFAEIFQQAADAGIVEPNAMALATADEAGRPSVRIVLLKGFDDDGFVFYTNLESRKASELRANPHAALCFYWQPINRQVRVEGTITPVSDAEADEYFASRPRGSQIGAWTSRQSSQLPSRDELLKEFHQTEARFEGIAIPRPPFWSGFRLRPHHMEFWTAGEFRLHDRLIFDRDGQGVWRTTRFYP